MNSSPPQYAWPYALSTTDNHFIIGQVVLLNPYHARTYTFPLSPHILHYMNSSPFLSFLNRTNSHTMSGNLLESGAEGT